MDIENKDLEMLKERDFGGIYADNWATFYYHVG